MFLKSGNIFWVLARIGPICHLLDSCSLIHLPLLLHIYLKNNGSACRRWLASYLRRLPLLLVNRELWDLIIGVWICSLCD
jgi:hypothetical protein